MSDNADYWTRIGADDRLTGARRKLSMDELRMLFQHARDSLLSAPKPEGEIVRLSADLVPYSSIVGGGLVLKKIDGRAGFIVNFIGTTEGVTKEETAALSQQFAWFVSNYGCHVPARASIPQEQEHMPDNADQDFRLEGQTQFREWVLTNAVNADEINLILAENARIENGELANGPFLAVQIAEAIDAPPFPKQESSMSDTVECPMCRGDGEDVAGVYDHCQSCGGTGATGDACPVCGCEYRGQGGYLSCECPATPVTGNPTVSSEDEAEHFIQAAIDRAPEPLRRLGEYLTEVLDEDQWKTAEKMLLGAAVTRRLNQGEQETHVRRLCQNIRQR